VDLSGLESLLYSLHTMGAVFLKTPELELSKVEAAKLAEAVGRVASHYPVNIAPQSMDVVNLVMVASMIYGGRYAAYRARTKATSKAQSAPPQQAPVVDVIVPFRAPGMDGTA
jgi:hypothetical protein